MSSPATSAIPNYHISKVNSAYTDNPLTLTVGNNRILFSNGRQWILESSDLDVAAKEIVSLMEENERLKLEAAKSEELRSKIEKDVKDEREMKSVIMAMLTEERQLTMALRQEVAGYKEELQQSYAEIVKLRTQLSNKV
mmetsp:Transcript_26634/g.39568  ORF Transcript_26634/g.39568 Transcript_26634/m.39568 type:complete len:139 (-) Transcript_26634:18-434(-)